MEIYQNFSRKIYNRILSGAFQNFKLRKFQTRNWFVFFVESAENQKNNFHHFLKCGFHFEVKCLRGWFKNGQNELKSHVFIRSGFECTRDFKSMAKRDNLIPFFSSHIHSTNFSIQPNLLVEGFEVWMLIFDKIIYFYAYSLFSGVSLSCANINTSDLSSKYFRESSKSVDIVAYEIYVRNEKQSRLHNSHITLAEPASCKTKILYFWVFYY